MKVKHAGRYRSDAFAAIHEAAEALHHVGGSILVLLPHCCNVAREGI